MPVTFSDAGATANWVVREGATISRTFTATTGTANTPVNITSYTIAAEVTAAATSDAALKTFTVTKTNAAAGEFRITISAATNDLAVGTYFWAMEWDTGSATQPLVSGSLIVKDWTL